MKQNKILLSSSNFDLDLVFQDFNSLYSYKEKFEHKLETELKEDVKVVALNSGTSAIHLALKMLNVTKDDEVICQSFTYVATAFPILYQLAKPIFIDSEKDTWNMCPIFLKKAIEDRISKGKKPKAIIVVHLYGMPAKMDEIILIGKKYNIPILEDAAEALGSKFKGLKCGTFGDYGVISFNENKIITTSSGGALICRSDEDKKRIIFLSTQAKDDTPFYNHSEIGFNYRISNILAMLGVEQMNSLEDNITYRRKNNEFYENIFTPIKGVKLLKEPNSQYYSNHWLTCIIIDSNIAGFSNEDLRLELLKENIESRHLWKPMHIQPVFIDSDYYGDHYSEELFKKGLCLPSGSNLTQNDRNRIEEVIHKLRII